MRLDLLEEEKKEFSLSLSEKLPLVRFFNKNSVKLEDKEAEPS